MSLEYLEFEKPVAELQEKISELKRVSVEGGLNLDKEIRSLEARSTQLTRDIFSRLSAWQITQLARHPLRPYTLDYVKLMVEDFQELHGDRMYADDPSIICGLGLIDGRRVAIIGHQKGKNTRERTWRNFGMPRPEGYRKAQRIMKLAERFRLPVVTLIDTPGAYPGIGAEERGQSEAIAKSIEVMVSLDTPIISVVIGEGGSGGALAIGVCDKLTMLQYSTYSVISPEGCASILWKSAEKAAEAAEAMGVTTPELARFGLVDEIIAEPLGGAHRNYREAAENLKLSLVASLESFTDLETSAVRALRHDRLMSFGRFAIKE